MSKANERSLIPDPNALPALLKKKDDPRLEQLAGSKELHVLKEILARLSAQAGHGNRILEAHHVLLLHLLGFYNPMMRSLRTFELASQHRRVQEVVGLDRVCRSTHSDFLAVADPEILMPVVQALRKKVPTVGEWRDNADLGALLDNVVAYDGSYFEVPVSVAWAMQMHMPHPAKRTAKKTAKALPEADAEAEADADAGQRADRPMRKRMARIRLNLHWATRRGVPLGVSLDGAKGSESAAFIKALEADVIYVIDRGIFSFMCLEELHKHGSHYVARLKDNIPLDPRRHRPLSAEDAAHGVVSDCTGYFPGSRNHKAPHLLVREIVIVDPARPGSRAIRLITDLLELPAHIIGLLYQQRWQIELFFRWLKVHNHFAHMVTHSREGVHFVFYVMTIALLLHSLFHGRPPSKYDVMVYQMAFMDGAMDPGMMAGLARLEREKELARQRYARKKAIKKLT